MREAFPVDSDIFAIWVALYKYSNTVTLQFCSRGSKYDGRIIEHDTWVYFNCFLLFCNGSIVLSFLFNCSIVQLLYCSGALLLCCSIGPLLCCFIVLLFNCCTVQLLYCCIVQLLCCSCSIALLFYCSIALMFYCSIVQLLYSIVRLLYCCMVLLLYCSWVGPCPALTLKVALRKSEFIQEL